MKKKLFLLLFLFTLFIPLNIYADVIMPGQKVVDWCYLLENIYNYPEYTFFIFADIASNPLTERNVISNNQCFRFYRFSQIYAVKNNDFQTIISESNNLWQQHVNAAQINNLNERDRLYQEFQNYFKNNPKLSVSDLKLTAYPTVAESNPLEKAVTVLSINNLNDDNLDIKKVKDIYTYTDGFTEEKYYQNQNERPSPSKTFTLSAILKDYLGLEVIITIIVEFLIIWLFIKGNPLKPFLVSLLINIITVPIANYVYYIIFNILIIEIFVFIIESLLLMWLLKVKYLKALLISFVANFITFVLGFFLFTLPIFSIIF